MSRSLLLLTVLLLALPIRGEAAANAAAFDAVSAASTRGAWTVTVQGGWPWLGLRGQLGVGRRLALVGEVETAILRRLHPGGGVAWRVVDRARGRFTAEALVGGQIQLGELAHQGPSVVLRLRLAARPAPVGPYLVASTRHTLLFHRARTYRLGEAEPDVAVDVEHRWSPSVILGLAFAPTPHFGFDVGMDFHFVDLGVVAVSLPGFHVGLHFGNTREEER